MARLSDGKNIKQKRNQNFEINKAVGDMVKDIDEQLMTMADEKINYEQLKRSPVSTYLLKLDQYSRRLAQDIKLSKEADVKVKGKRR